MKLTKHIFFLFAAAIALAACDNSNIPSGPVASTDPYDTVNCTGIDIPDGSLTVRNALKVGKKLPFKGSTSDFVYVKGIVTGFHSGHEAAMKGSYQNGMFYIKDNWDTEASFYCYHTKGLNDAGFTSMDQLQLGDFVVVKCKIQNYNGTMETDGSAGSYLVYSSNDLVYPFVKVTYFNDKFGDGIGTWTKQVISGSVGDIWSLSTSFKNITANSNGTDCESWLISSAFQVDGPHQNPVKLYFSHGIKGTDALTLAAQHLRVKVRTNDGEWLDLPDAHFRTPSTLGFQVYSDSLDITSYADGMVQVAFAYKCISGLPFKPQWKISNISVCENKRQRNKFH